MVMDVMMIRKFKILLMSLLLGGTMAAAATGRDASGTWRMQNGKITVHVSPCGDGVCGRIVAMKKPLDKHGKPKLDKDNPDPALRSRPVIGVMVLLGMKPDGQGSWVGRIYNADDGKTYSSHMSLDGDTMRVRGCVAFICKKIVFERVD